MGEKKNSEKRLPVAKDEVVERSLIAVAEERAIKLREFWKHLVGKKKVS